MVDLGAHYLSGVHRFLQTAIVIDDQAEFAPVTRAIASVELPAPTGSLLNRAAALAEKAAPEQPANDSLDSPAPPDSDAEAGEGETSDDGDGEVGLNAKVLSEAFLAKNMICGLYRPTTGDNMVESTTGAAR